MCYSGRNHGPEKLNLFFSFFLNLGSHHIINKFRFFFLVDSTESGPELPPDNLEVLHSARSGGLPPLGLDGPVVLADPGAGISARRANLLLDVEGHLAAPHTQGVGLVVAFTK